MMRRRRVGRPVARAAVGTAVVAGTAGAVRHHQEKKWAKQAYEDQAVMEQQMEAEQYQDPPPQQYAPPSPPSSAGGDMMDQLNQLTQLHASGVLTDEEFSAAKQKLLAS